MKGCFAFLNRKKWFCAFWKYLTYTLEQITIPFAWTVIKMKAGRRLVGFFHSKLNSDKMREKLHSDVFLRVSGEPLPGECDTAGLTAPS